MVCLFRRQQVPFIILKLLPNLSVSGFYNLKGKSRVKWAMLFCPCGQIYDENGVPKGHKGKKTCTLYLTLCTVKKDFRNDI